MLLKQWLNKEQFPAKRTESESLLTAGSKNTKIHTESLFPFPQTHIKA